MQGRRLWIWLGVTVLAVGIAMALTSCGKTTTTTTAADTTTAVGGATATPARAGGGPLPMTAVPYVIGESEAEATKILQAAGFVVKPTESYGGEIRPGDIAGQTPPAGTRSPLGTIVTIAVQQQGLRPIVVVPPVVGYVESVATQILQTAGFVVKANQAYSDVRPGSITAQTPPPGTYTKKGANVGVTVSLGNAAPGAVTIPDMTGKTQDQATQALEAAGFKVETLGALSDTVPEGSVIGQAPSAGLSTPPGAIVTIAVSQGPPPTGQPLPTTTSTS